MNFLRKLFSKDSQENFKKEILSEQKSLRKLIQISFKCETNRECISYAYRLNTHESRNYAINVLNIMIARHKSIDELLKKIEKRLEYLNKAVNDIKSQNFVKKASNSNKFLRDRNFFIMREYICLLEDFSITSEVNSISILISQIKLFN